MGRRPGRRRLLALVAGCAALLITPVMAGAAPLTSAQIYEPVGFFRFCSEAQLDVANIDEAAMQAAGISIGGTIYADLNADFQWSKSSVDRPSKRILTVTWVEYADAAKTQPRAVRCKLRTGESLNKGAWPAGSDNNSGRFAVDTAFGFGAIADGVSTNPVDQSCTSVNQRTIDAVWNSLTPAQQSASPYKPTDGTLVTAPDTLAGGAPQWLVETNPLSLAGGVLTAESLSMLVPVGAYPGSATAAPRFEGAHYCTLVPPTYLRDVLLGARTVA